MKWFPLESRKQIMSVHQRRFLLPNARPEVHQRLWLRLEVQRRRCLLHWPHFVSEITEIVLDFWLEIWQFLVHFDITVNVNFALWSLYELDRKHILALLLCFIWRLLSKTKFFIFKTFVKAAILFIISYFFSGKINCKFWKISYPNKWLHLTCSKFFRLSHKNKSI